MKIYEVKDILKATLLTGEDQLERTVIGAGGADIMEAFLAAAAKDAVISDRTHRRRRDPYRQGCRCGGGGLRPGQKAAGQCDRTGTVL